MSSPILTELREAGRIEPESWEMWLQYRPRFYQRPREQQNQFRSGTSRPGPNDSNQMKDTKHDS
jgi:hypothetical protein